MQSPASLVGMSRGESSALPWLRVSSGELAPVPCEERSACAPWPGASSPLHRCGSERLASLPKPPRGHGWLLWPSCQLLWHDPWAAPLARRLALQPLFPTRKVLVSVQCVELEYSPASSHIALVPGTFSGRIESQRAAASSSEDQCRLLSRRVTGCLRMACLGRISPGHFWSDSHETKRGPSKRLNGAADLSRGCRKRKLRDFARPDTF